MWFKLTLTVTELSVNWKTVQQLTVIEHAYLINSNFQKLLTSGQKQEPYEIMMTALSQAVF